MNAENKIHVAIVGASGAVGETMLSILEERNFPLTELTLLASKRSAGRTLMFRGKPIAIKELTPESFAGVDIALFSAGASVSAEFAPHAVKAGAVVIDNTSFFRRDPAIPLVVPEINPQEIFRHKGIIANPNCSTIQMLLAVKPIYDKVGVKRIVVSTYQSVSGAGRSAINEMLEQTRQVLDGESIMPRKFPHQIAFNAIPQIDIFMDNGYTKEEMKMIWETKKIMGDESIAVTSTCVRLPFVSAHAESVNIETHKKISAAEVRELLSHAPGVKVVDDPSQNLYPMPIKGAGRDPSYVGRIREDESIPNGINLWVVSDNLRKGAALNAIQIAEVLMKGQA